MRGGKTKNSSDPVNEPGRFEPGKRAVRLWSLVVLVAVLLPSFLLLSSLGLFLVTNSLDPAFEMGVSDTFVNGMLIASSGLLAGLFGGLLARTRGWRLLSAPIAALIIGVAILVTFAAHGSGAEVDNHVGMIATIWIGQTAGIILATRLVGLRLAGAVGVLIVVGIGAATAIQVIS